MANRRALCVGINDFKHFPDAKLNGCVNDANDMAKLLKEVYGFGNTDIVTLTNAKATKKNVMKQLSAMVNDAKAGKLSYLVFSFSSHGTQIPDTSKDEPDTADEVFCPYDLAQKGNQWDPARIISDDELHDLFDQLPPSVQLEVFMDTCHSGTGLKNIDFNMLLLRRMKPRYLPPPSYKAFAKDPRMVGLAKKLSKTKMSKDLAPSASTSKRKQIVLWSGCRADQTSADAFFDGRYNGAFTYNYIKIVRANPKLSRGKVRSKLIAQLKKDGFEQIPQLETDATNRNKRSG
jgi:hypothetical protein